MSLISRLCLLWLVVVVVFVTKNVSVAQVPSSDMEATEAPSTELGSDATNDNDNNTSNSSDTNESTNEAIDRPDAGYRLTGTQPPAASPNPPALTTQPLSPTPKPSPSPSPSSSPSPPSPPSPLPPSPSPPSPPSPPTTTKPPAPTTTKPPAPTTTKPPAPTTNHPTPSPQPSQTSSPTANTPTQTPAPSQPPPEPPALAPHTTPENATTPKPTHTPIPATTSLGDSVSVQDPAGSIGTQANNKASKSAKFPAWSVGLLVLGAVGAVVVAVIFVRARRAATRLGDDTRDSMSNQNQPTTEFNTTTTSRNHVLTNYFQNCSLSMDGSHDNPKDNNNNDEDNNDDKKYLSAQSGSYQRRSTRMSTRRVATPRRLLSSTTTTSSRSSAMSISPSVMSTFSSLNDECDTSEEEIDREFSIYRSTASSVISFVDSEVCPSDCSNNNSVLARATGDGLPFKMPMSAIPDSPLGYAYKISEESEDVGHLVVDIQSNQQQQQQQQQVVDGDHAHADLTETEEEEECSDHLEFEIGEDDQILAAAKDQLQPQQSLPRFDSELSLHCASHDQSLVEGDDGNSFAQEPEFQDPVRESGESYASGSSRAVSEESLFESNRSEGSLFGRHTSDTVSSMPKNSDVSWGTPNGSFAKGDVTQQQQQQQQQDAAADDGEFGAAALSPRTTFGSLDSRNTRGIRGTMSSEESSDRGYSELYDRGYSETFSESCFSARGRVDSNASYSEERTGTELDL